MFSHPPLKTHHRVAVSNLIMVVSKGIELIERSKLRPGARYAREEILVLQMIGLHHCARSAALLLRHGRTQSAKVLERAVFEAYVRMRFLYSCPGLEHAHALLLAVKDQRLKTLRKMIGFHQRNPGISNQYGDMRMDSSLLEKLESDRKEFLNTTGTCKCAPDLYTMSKESDRVELARGPKEPTLEQLYFLIYWLDSEIAHAGLMGLLHFVRGRTDRHLEVATEGNLGEIVDCAIMTMNLCSWAQAFYVNRMSPAGLISGAG